MSLYDSRLLHVGHPRPSPGDGSIPTMSLGCSVVPWSTLVDHSVVCFCLFSAEGHSEVDHSVVGFQCFFELILPEVGFLLLVDNGGLWVCPYC